MLLSCCLYSDNAVSLITRLPNNCLLNFLRKQNLESGIFYTTFPLKYAESNRRLYYLATFCALYPLSYRLHEKDLNLRQHNLFFTISLYCIGEIYYGIPYSTLRAPPSQVYCLSLIKSYNDKPT